MSSALLLMDQIHARALEVSTRYRREEAELVDVLIQVERYGVFIQRQHASLFAYATTELGLSENVAYALIAVARKAREVPALGARLRDGAVTLSNARRVASVLTVQNQAEWVEKACALSSRQLEREIARVRPEIRTPERASYAGADRVRLEVGLSEEQMLKLRHAQDLLCQSRRRTVSLEETIGVLTSEFIKRVDPVERARRQTNRKGSVLVQPSEQVGELVTRRVRSPIPAAELHAVNLRDQRRCTHILPNGSRCHQSRWVEIHHIQLVSEGGPNTVENLITLCSAHHKLMHQADPRGHSPA